MAVGAGELDIVVQRDGTVLARESLELGPYAEDLRFTGAVRGMLPNSGALPALTVTPHWRDADVLTAEAVELSYAELPARRYERAAFSPQASSLIAAMLADGRLREGDAVRWDVVARRALPPERPSATTRVRRAPYPLTRATLPDDPPGELALRCEPRVLEEIRQKILDAGVVERAGLLLGRLLHDPARAVARVAVLDAVDLVAGREGASAVHFALGPDSFLAARRAVAARSDGLQTVGWWHSHPSCESCLSRPECDSDTIYFSSHDQSVHAAAFGAPYMLALVGGKLGSQPASRPGFRIYAWRGGRIVERELVLAERRMPSTLPTHEGGLEV